MSGFDEKDEQLRQPPDALAAALEPTRSHDERDLRASLDEKAEVGRSLEDKEADKIEKIEERRADSTSDDDDGNGEGSSDGRQRQQAHLTQTKSYATDTSAATGVTGVEDLNRPKSWHSKLNPLRWGKVPPIPEEPAVSREASAGFWSLLTFAWMAPLMTVCCLLLAFSLFFFIWWYLDAIETVSQ